MINLDDLKISQNSIRDLDTGLSWEAKTLENINQRYTWREALEYVKKLNTEEFDGCTDWRLPTAKELVFLVDYSKSKPAINTEKFPNIRSSYHWTSTIYAEQSR